MHTSAAFLPYRDTHAFSKLAIDYVNKAEQLKPFYRHPVSLNGIEAAIEERKNAANHRALLVEVLQQQYQGIALSGKQASNLDALLSANCFTITTAHQPNIFTGPLYFIYKILHTIKLADWLQEQLPAYQFVPVYYMGSEDADLDELGHIWLDGEKVTWDTSQQGAVGRMHTKGLEQIIQRLEGEFAGLPYGAEMIALCKKAYCNNENIQQATLQLVNHLFNQYGLIILIPDNADLKRVFNPVVKKELLEQFSQPLVEETSQQLDLHYKVQASGRPVNLFYLNDEGRRERIEVSIDDKTGEKIFSVYELGLVFSQTEILTELEDHPERFSGNVILRGLFQETILPNIVFIGGGGEIAYWMQLKKVFEATGTTYPMLILRNSFLLINEKNQLLKQKLGLSNKELFLSELDLMNLLVKRNTDKKLDSVDEQKALYALYEKLQLAANDIDPTLKAHIAALHVASLKGLKNLDKKMLRAERRRNADQQQQVKKLLSALFPANNLQERIDNFMPVYAQYGKAILDSILAYSLALEQQFAIVEIAG